MNKSLIGIEISNGNIKMIYGRQSSKSFKIKACLMSELDNKIIKDGNILEDTKLIQIISDFVKVNKIKTRKVAINIQSSMIITKEIVLPKLKRDELYKFITFQKQNYFPIDISDYRIDYQINKIIKNQESYEATIIAVPNALIEPYIIVFKKLRLVLINADTTSNSLAEFFKTEVKDGDKTVIDIGDEVTNLIILSNYRILFSRTIMYGISELKDVEREIDKILNFYNSKFIAYPTTEIYITGKGAYSDDVIKCIKSIFAIDIKRDINFKSIIQPKGKKILNYENEFYFTSLIGLMNKNYRHTFNLLPRYYLDEANNKKIRNYTVLNFIIIGIVITIFSMLPDTFISQKEMILADINLKVKDTKFEASNRISDELNLLRQELDRHTNILKNIENDSIASGNILEVIIDCIPEKVYVSSIDIDNSVKHTVITGTAENIKTNGVLEYISNLETYTDFKNINFNVSFEESLDNLTPYTIEFDIGEVSDMSIAHSISEIKESRLK